MADMPIATRPTATEKAQQEIDAEISRLQEPESIRRLKSRRNALAPISRLPAEMLSGLFMSRIQEPSSDSREIIPMTHVCRYWRNVALESPLLWSRIPFVQQADLYCELVSRSKEVPLRLTFTTNELPAFATTLVSANVHRIRELLLDVTPSVAKILIQCLNKPAPILQILQLQYSIQSTKDMPSFSQFFDGQAPILRKVYMGHGPVDWDWPPFANVTGLHVHGTNPPLSLTVLRKLPQLQHLDSSDVLPECPTNFIGNILGGDMVDLKSLLHITLQNSSFRSYSFFMSHIRYPSTAHVDLFVQPDVGDFRHPIIPFLTGGPHLIIETQCDVPDTIRFSTPTMNMEVDIPIGRPTYSFSAALRAFSLGTPIKSISLDVDHDPKTKVDESQGGFDWTSILPFLQEVNRVDLKLSTSARILLIALNYDTRTVHWKKLRSLGISFKGADEVSVAYDLGILKKVIHSRVTLGTRLSEARLTTDRQSASSDVPGIINEIRGLVDSLHWDNGGDVS